VCTEYKNGKKRALGLESVSLVTKDGKISTLMAKLVSNVTEWSEVLWRESAQDFVR